MPLTLFCCRWGHTQLTVDSCHPRVDEHMANGLIAHINTLPINQGQHQSKPPSLPTRHSQFHNEIKDMEQKGDMDCFDITFKCQLTVILLLGSLLDLTWGKSNWDVWSNAIKVFNAIKFNELGWRMAPSYVVGWIYTLCKPIKANF